MAVKGATGMNICEILGLNPRLVAEINITLRPDSFPVVDVRMVIPEAEGLRECIAKYHLVEIPDGTEE